MSQWFKNPKSNLGLIVNVYTINGKKLEVGIQHQTSNVRKLKIQSSPLLISLVLQVAVTNGIILRQRETDNINQMKIVSDSLTPIEYIYDSWLVLRNMG